MILNMNQQQAIENGQPVAINVAGTECVLLRRDIYLRLDPDFDAGPLIVYHGIAEDQIAGTLEQSQPVLHIEDAGVRIDQIADTGTIEHEPRAGILESHISDDRPVIDLARYDDAVLLLAAIGCVEGYQQSL